jgi:hypothetical protein
MTTPRGSSPKVFLPAASRGWIWPWLTVGLGGVFIITAGSSIGAGGLQVAIGALLVTLGGATALAVPRMRYEISPGLLRISCRPVFEAEVPLAELSSVERRDLVPSVWAAARFPGLALGTVRYVGMGPIRMCATRAAKGVLVLNTARGRFGVTPADEQGFLGALGEAGGHITPSQQG